MPPYKLGTRVKNKNYEGEYTIVKVNTAETKDYIIRMYKIKSGVGEESYGKVSVEYDIDEAVLERSYDIIDAPEEPVVEIKTNRLDQI